jgi:hypothetical protein
MKKSYSVYREILETAKELLADGSLEDKSKEEYVCFAVTKATDMITRSLTHINSLEVYEASFKIENKIKSVLKAYAYYDDLLISKRILNLGPDYNFYEVQCQRWMLIEALIDYYEDMENE